MEVDIKECIQLDGLEFPKWIVWKTWQPGMKYVKYVGIQNKSVHTRKLRLNIPHTPYFHIVYPKSEKRLAAGTTFKFPVTFAPNERRIYTDSLSIQINDEDSVVIDLRAVLPEYNINLPEKIDFGQVAVGDKKKQVFTLKNRSTLSTPFTLHTGEPFYLGGDLDCLAPNEKRMMEISFLPKIPGKFQQNALCTYGSKNLHTTDVELCGIGVFPGIYVSVDKEENSNHQCGGTEVHVEFPMTIVGCLAEKNVTVENLSPVNAQVTIKPCSLGAGFHPTDCFSTEVQSTLVPPRAKVEIPFYYRPSVGSTEDFGYFKLINSGNCGETILRCHGTSSKLSLALSTDHLDFGICKLGEPMIQRVLFLENRSAEETPYQLICGSNKITESGYQTQITTVFPLLNGSASGSVGPRSKIRIVVGFSPSSAGHFLRRLALLSPNTEPQFLSLFGTCHDSKEQPHPLSTLHLKNTIGGVSFDNPLQVSRHPQQPNAFEEYVTLRHAEDTVLHMPPISVDPAYIDFTPTDALITKAVRCVLHYEEVVQLGLDVTDNKFGLKRTLIVQNHTSQAMQFKWTPQRILRLTDDTDSFKDICASSIQEEFSIEPPEAELPGQGSCQFTIIFQPTRVGQFFFHEFEGFASFRAFRDCSLTDSDSVVPPICVIVQCFGNTFPKNEEPFLPNFTLDKGRIKLPRVDSGGVIFDTISLRNNSDLPLLLEQANTALDLENADQDLNSRSVTRIIPPVSLIPPKTYAVLVIRQDTTCLQPRIETCDSDVGFTTQDKVILCFNRRPEYQMTIPVELNVYRPRLALENDGQLYFQPTQVQAKSLRRFGVINKSSLATSFKWHIPSEHRKELHVEPTEGTIQPNEIQYHKWTFSPSEPGLHKFGPQLIYQGTGKEAKRKQLKVIALAEQVTLKIQPDHMVLEPLTIGASQSTEAILHNCTLASTYFTLYAKTILSDVDAEEMGEISITPQTGWLPGLCSTPIQFVVCPKRKGSYRIQLSYKLWIPENATPLQETCNDSVPRILLTNQVTIGEILLEASFPTLEIVDVHGSGKLSTFSTSELWRDLDIDGLNRSLSEDPTALELEDSAKTRPMFRDHPAVNVDRGPVFDWFVGSSVATIQDEVSLDESKVTTESQLHVLFENKRPVDVECLFMFPSVYVVDPPSWADDGTYTDDELHHRRVENDRLFDISPRKFRLHSGETTHVLVTYRHKLPGADHLPVLMKINGGREIKLRLFGITLPPTQPYFHFAQRRHILPPIQITEGNRESGCLYRLPLRNPSARRMQFLVAPLVFSDETKQSQSVSNEVTTQRTDSTGPLEWGIPVFRCLTREGIVEPGGFGYLEFNFRPLEAETYLVNCTISIRDAEVTCSVNEKEAFLDSLSLELEVKAYDPRSPDCTASSCMLLQNQVKEKWLLPVFHSEPHAPRIPTPSCPVYLSPQSFSLFQIPRGCCVRRLVHMNYRCEEDEGGIGKKNGIPRIYRFRLSTRYHEDAQFVQITPHTGRIEPGQSIQLEIQFFAKGDPRWITVEMTCELFDDAKEINYCKELKAWEEESERRKFEFVITDRKTKTSKLKSNQPCGQVSQQSDPISQPQYPSPDLLHLSISAQILGDNELTSDNLRRIYHRFVDSVSVPEQDKRLGEGQLRSEKTSQVQRAICTDLLSVLLNELLADTEFTQQLQCATCSPESDPTYRSDSLNRPDDPAPLYTQLVYSTESGKSIRSPEPTTETVENECNWPQEAGHGKSEELKTPDFQPSTDAQLSIKNEGTKVTEIGKNEGLKQSIALHSIIEETVSEIIRNILAEANAHEVDLTTESLRVVCLPPKK